MAYSNQDEVVGRIKDITELQRLVLVDMNCGKYLIKLGQSEGLAVNPNIKSISTAIKAGTIDALLKAGMIRKSLASDKHFLLTDKGRDYRSIK